MSRLMLKIWAMGVLISIEINLSNCILRPSRSRLFFGSKAFIKSPTWTGPVLPRARLGVLGFTLM